MNRTAVHRSSFLIPHSSLAVILCLAALAFFLLLFFLFALFDFAAALGVLEAHRIAQLVIELLERRDIESLQSW